jgi:hypothetical protein
MSNDMQNGPELDLAVGKAIGLNVEIETDYVGDRGRYDRICVETVNEWDGIFVPSHSIAEAFDAADKFGLFDRGSIILDKLTPIGGAAEWQVCRLTCGGCDYEVLGSGPTPAVAICRAIIKLAEAKQEAR